MKEFITTTYGLFKEILPKNWNKIVYHLRLFDDVSTSFFYIKVDGCEKYISDQELIKYNVFSKDEYYQVRTSVVENSIVFREETGINWTGYTLVINRTGKFTLDYEYDSPDLNISEEWMKTFLC